MEELYAVGGELLTAVEILEKFGITLEDELPTMGEELFVLALLHGGQW